jgi:hypothetical protein
MSENNIADLKTSLGTVKLLKGTRLYYYGYNYPNCGFTLCEKLFLRTYFHPADKIGKRSEDKITVIELQKDITLIFMINKINGSHIYSYISQYLDMSNLEKSNPEPSNTYRILIDDKLIDAWQKEGLNGWISSISSLYLDVVIFNNLELFKIIEFNPLQISKLSKYINWLNIYHPEIILNTRYKLDIEESFKKTKDDEFKYIKPFILFLRNSKINYINAPILKLKWKSTLVKDIGFWDYHDKFNSSKPKGLNSNVIN